MPSIRGTEKPAMSASSRPTTKPRAARPAARLTVTDDLPTPPLPDEMARTRVRPGISVAGGFSWARRRARAMRSFFCPADISLVRTWTLGHPGQAADPGGDVASAAGSGAGSRRWSGPPGP